MADQVITKQELIDAQKDSESLSQFINGSETETVLTRLAKEYPTLANAVYQIMEAGGYEPFATETELKASIPSASKKAAKAMDTKKIWYWNGSAWIDTGLSELDQAKADATTKANAAEANAKTYVNEKTKSISDIDIGEALFAHVDANDNLVEVTGANGEKYLTGLDGSVQENLLDNKQAIEFVKETLNHVNKDEIAFAFTDKEDRVVAYLKNDGNLILVDLDQSVQENLLSNKQANELSNGALNRVDEDEIAIAFTDKEERVFAYLKNDGNLILFGLNQSVQDELNQTKAFLNDLLTTVAKTEVKTVKGLVKSNYTVDASTILSMKVEALNSMPYIKMDSPYRKDDYFIHPCVIELSEPMRGYKYLMCITPYYLRNPLEENPTIYGSNDQVNWEMLTGFDQPLDNPPDWDEPESGEHGYLSDNWWAYDPINKELYCCYRKGYYADYEAGYTNDDRMQLLYRKTTNGLQWSAPKMFTPETTLGADGQIAPSLVYDQVNKRWVMIYLKSGDWRIYVRFNTDLKVEGWTEPQEIGYRAFADANNIRGWHVETKFIGDKLFMLVGDSTNGKYYFAKANDDTFLNWTFSANSVLADTWTYGAYKASFLEVPQQNGNIKLRLYFTDIGAGRLRTSLSPEISII